MITYSKLGEGTGQESGPLYASWQSARALTLTPLATGLASEYAGWG